MKPNNENILARLQLDRNFYLNLEGAHLREPDFKNADFKISAEASIIVFTLDRLIRTFEAKVKEEGK